MRAAALLAGLAAASAQSAWEGPGSKHWKHATHISDPGTLDSMSDEAIANDRTLFVRWIASDG